MQNYIVLEITRNAAGNIAVYPHAKETEEAAWGKYYDILTRASSSQSPVHSAALLTVEGFKIENKSFKHTPPAPAPAPDPEPDPEPESE